MAQPRFVFPLQALLEQRLHQEKECQRAVAQIQQQIDALRGDIASAEFRIAQENQTLTAEKLTGTLDMQYIALEKRFVGALHLKIALTTQKIATVEVQLAASRTQLLAAARGRKVIDKLREKQLARWRQEQDRKEAETLDEIGTQGVTRRANQDEISAALAAAEGES